MMLYLKYYLHRLFPGFFKKPRVLLSKTKVVRPSAVVSTVYTIFFNDYQESDYFFEQLSADKIPVICYPSRRTNDDYMRLRQSFLVYGQLDSKYYEHAPQIAIDEQFVSDEVSVTEAVLVDWEPHG